MTNNKRHRDMNCAGRRLPLRGWEETEKWREILCRDRSVAPSKENQAGMIDRTLKSITTREGARHFNFCPLKSWIFPSSVKSRKHLLELTYILNIQWNNLASRDIVS